MINHVVNEIAARNIEKYKKNEQELREKLEAESKDVNSKN